jgi:endonuclease/exonuclease/phosphatase family metal-dependent hydrolase
MAKDARPKVLLGDMNDGPDSRTVRLLKRELTDVLEAQGRGHEGTYPLLPLLAPLRLDYVLASHHFQSLRGVVLRVTASDHYPVVADLALREMRAKATVPPTPGVPPG